MNALAIIGCTAGGALLGFLGGFWVGEREGGDFNFAPVIYAPFGALVGGAVGVIVGAVAFA